MTPASDDAAVWNDGEPLDTACLPLLRTLLADTPRTPSEYSLANIFLFRRVHHYRLCRGPTNALFGITYDGERHALPLGRLDADAALELLNTADCIYPLSRQEAESLSTQIGGMISANDADADYIFDAGRLSALEGAKDKRRQMRDFATRNPVIGPFDPDKAHATLAHWIEETARGPDHADVRECREAIDMAGQLGLEGICVSLDDEPAGFLLASLRACQDKVVHFAKARRDLEGAYPFMFARFAQMSDVPVLNFEQDLGIPALARAKQALSPITRLQKFRLSKEPS